MRRDLISVSLRNWSINGTFPLASAAHAEAFAPYDSMRNRPYPYYQIPVKNDSVFYVVIGNVMEVRRFVYSRSDWERKLN